MPNIFDRSTGADCWPPVDERAAVGDGRPLMNWSPAGNSNPAGVGPSLWSSDESSSVCNGKPTDDFPSLGIRKPNGPSSSLDNWGTVGVWTLLGITEAFGDWISFGTWKLIGVCSSPALDGIN